MNPISLTDGPFADDFFPFSLTRSVADIRCGILSIRQKWGYFFSLSDSAEDTLEIPANILTDNNLVEAIRSGDTSAIEKAIAQATKLLNTVDIIRMNDTEIRRDFNLITRGRSTEPIPESNSIILCKSIPASNKNILQEQIFIEAGAVVEHCILNVSEGPIYIGKDALVMEGSMIRGPFALGEHAVIKMGAKIYGATTIGPYCTVGGEIKNSVIFGYSNKAHDGYLGDSVVGEWCNLGGGTSNSNIKNNAGAVKLWNPIKNDFTDGGLKCGLFMGDYSRSAINTSFNTGTVVGASANVFGKGLTPSYLSSFSWGYDPVETYDFEKAIQHIIQWKKFKNKSLTSVEISTLKSIFDQQNNLKEKTN